jgi:hypothetical protein
MARVGNDPQSFEGVDQDTVTGCRCSIEIVLRIHGGGRSPSGTLRQQGVVARSWNREVEEAGDQSDGIVGEVR